MRAGWPVLPRRLRPEARKGALPAQEAARRRRAGDLSLEILPPVQGLIPGES